MSNLVSKDDLVDRLNTVNNLLAIYQHMMELLSREPTYGGEKLFHDYKEEIVEASEVIEELFLLLPAPGKNFYRMSKVYSCDSKRLPLLKLSNDNNYSISQFFKEQLNLDKLHIELIKLKPSLGAEEKYKSNGIRDCYLISNINAQCTNDDLRMLGTLARCIELTEKNSRDPLTGLLNRNAAQSRVVDIIPSVFELNPNNSAPYLAILMIDIDFFKKVNDSIGYEGGDYALMLVAEVIQSSFERSLGNSYCYNDVVARWGGEEFLVAAPKISFENIELKAEEIRKAVENIDFKYPPNDEKSKTLKLTVSLGGAFVDGSQLNAGDSPDIETLRECADEQLYKAKLAGRNQCRIIEWTSSYQSEI